MIVNVKADGNVVVNRRTLSGPDLTSLLKGLVQLNPDQAVVIRGDEAGAYKYIVERAQHLQRSRGHERRLRDREMKSRRVQSRARRRGGWFCSCARGAGAGTTPMPVRRAIPVQEPPVARAIPVETPSRRAVESRPIRRALPVPEATEVPLPPTAGDPAARAATRHLRAAESPEQRQLNYANGLFGRKLYDLAIPEYEKFLGLYPNSPDRAAALFYMGEAYRVLNRIARRTHQFSKCAERFPRQRTGRARFLRPRGNFLQRQRLRVCAARFFIAPRRR